MRSNIARPLCAHLRRRAAILISALSSLSSPPARAADDIANFGLDRAIWTNGLAWAHSNPLAVGQFPHNGNAGLTYDGIVAAPFATFPPFAVNLDQDITINNFELRNAVVLSPTPFTLNILGDATFANPPDIVEPHFNVTGTTHLTSGVLVLQNSFTAGGQVILDPSTQLHIRNNFNLQSPAGITGTPFSFGQLRIEQTGVFNILPIPGLTNPIPITAPILSLGGAVNVNASTLFSGGVSTQGSFTAAPDADIFIQNQGAFFSGAFNVPGDIHVTNTDLNLNIPSATTISDLFLTNGNVSFNRNVTANDLTAQGDSDLTASRFNPAVLNVDTFTHNLNGSPDVIYSLPTVVSGPLHLNGADQGGGPNGVITFDDNGNLRIAGQTTLENITFDTDGSRVETQLFLNGPADIVGQVGIDADVEVSNVLTVKEAAELALNGRLVATADGAIFVNRDGKIKRFRIVLEKNQSLRNEGTLEAEGFGNTIEAKAGEPLNLRDVKVFNGQFINSLTGPGVATLDGVNAEIENGGFNMVAHNGPIELKNSQFSAKPGATAEIVANAFGSVKAENVEVSSPEGKISLSALIEESLLFSALMSIRYDQNGRPVFGVNPGNKVDALIKTIDGLELEVKNRPNASSPNQSKFEITRTPDGFTLQDLQQVNLEYMRASQKSDEDREATISHNGYVASLGGPFGAFIQLLIGDVPRFQFTANAEPDTSHIRQVVNGHYEFRSDGSIDLGTQNRLEVAGNLTNAGLVSIGPEGAALVKGSLTNTGKIDVNGALIIKGRVNAPAAAGKLQDPYSTASATVQDLLNLRSQIILGRNTPPGGTADGKWNGATGIASAAAAQAFSQDNIEDLSLGYALNSDLLFPYTTFAGEPVSSSDLLVRLTRNGDATLDGIVDDNDVSLVSGFYNPAYDPIANGPRHWNHGDFNFNGIIDDNDITIINGFYNPSVPPLATRFAALSPVPEPYPLLVLTLLALPFRRPRYRPFPK